MSIRFDEILWAKGPFQCGLYPNIKFFNMGMKLQLLNGETVIADIGYRGRFIVPFIPGNSVQKIKSYLGRQETVKRILKHFHVLSTVFIHDISLHSYCFHAVANLTQLIIHNSDPLFRIRS